MHDGSFFGTALVGLLFAALPACSASEGESTGVEHAAVAKGGTGTSKSGACKATASNGKTYSGTYTNDVDGLNCAGDWGSVACTDSSGKDNGKCREAKTTLPAPRPIPTTAPPVLAQDLQ